MGSDKSWAKSYILDPLSEPEPSDLTGPGTHFGSTMPPSASGAATTTPQKQKPILNPAPSSPPSNMDNPFMTPHETNPFRKDHTGSSLASRNGYLTPPDSASPRRERFSPNHRELAFSSYADETPRPRSSTYSVRRSPPQHAGLSRGNSLKERYPGDRSHRPLDQIRKEEKLAHRSPHLRKKYMPQADIIDRLDVTGGRYHHEGPYDATLASRNTSWKHSPVAAVADSTAEALKATPRENIIDALEKHYPIDGVASVPPGVPDRFGRVYDYEEGTDMMRDLGGNYKRWPGVEYKPDDLKGKGEPSYTIEKALKEHKHRHDQEGGIELQTRSRKKSDPAEAEALTTDYEGRADDRRHSVGHKVGEGLKRRIGSLRRKMD